MTRGRIRREKEDSIKKRNVKVREEKNMDKQNETERQRKTDITNRTDRQTDR